MAVSLSPLTGIPGVSNFGGHFGAYLKYAGFDALEVTGKSGRNVMIVIDGFRGEVSVTDAPAIDHVFDLEREIVDRFVREGRDKKEIVFLTTGIGALRTTFGCINSHYFDPAKPVDGTKGLFRTKQAGRTGLGTIMKDKKIGAIVVLAKYPHGENPYGAADWEKVKRAGAKLGEVVRVNRSAVAQDVPQGLRGADQLHEQAGVQIPSREELPVRNRSRGGEDQREILCGTTSSTTGAWTAVFPAATCAAPRAAGSHWSPATDQGRRVWVDGPEYETAAGFGSNLGVWNPEFIMEANWHCDNYGIDTITVAVIAAFLMECLQRGYLTREDTDGLELTWGNEAAVLQFIHQLAEGETEFSRQAGKGMLALVDWICGRYVRRTGKADPREELMRFAMQTKGLPFSLYRTHRSLSMQGSYAAASDIGAHHAAAWLIKIDLLGAFPTMEQKAQALVMYPRVRLGNDNLGLCKLPWVDVFNPESAKMKDTDIYINPASQELYADFYNGMLGTQMTWQEIFAQTDRDINLQRVMNVMVYGTETARHDRIPDRAIGPTDDALYDAEQEDNDRELAGFLEKPLAEVQGMPAAEKRELLMDRRKGQLRELVQTYYRVRGWNEEGVPTPETLKRIGLWEFLNGEARARILEMTA